MPLGLKEFKYNVCVVSDYAKSIFEGNAAAEAIDGYEQCLRNLLGHMEETRRLRQEKEALSPKAHEVFEKLVALAKEKFPEDKPFGRADIGGGEIPGTSVDQYHPFEGNVLSGIPVYWALAGGIHKDNPQQFAKFDVIYKPGLYHNVSGMLGGTCGLKIWDIRTLEVERLRHFVTVGEQFLAQAS